MPPCDKIILFVIDKPSPVPPVLLFLDVSNLKNGLMAFSLSCASMPGPSSSIRIIYESSDFFKLISVLFEYLFEFSIIFEIDLLNDFLRKLNSICVPEMTSLILNLALL